MVADPPELAGADGADAGRPDADLSGQGEAGDEPEIRQGDVYTVDLGDPVGSEPGFLRP